MAVTPAPCVIWRNGRGDFLTAKYTKDVNRICIMTSKELEELFFKWLLKPLGLVAPYLRTNYSFDGQVITVKRPFGKGVSVSIDELDEIGVETTDQGPFVEDSFWILKRGSTRIRIGDPHPVFKMLMERFGSLDGFDWRPFNQAMSCTGNCYFLCWRRSNTSG